MRILPASSPARYAAIFAISVLGLGGTAWGYNRAAIEAFDRVARSEAWLQPARSRLSLAEKVKAPWLDHGGIVALTGPRAIRIRASESFPIVNMSGGKRAIANYNWIVVGCDALARYRTIEECGGAAAARRFRTIDANFSRSILDQDHYVALAGRAMRLADKIGFSADICNYYPTDAAVTLSVAYHSSDRLADEKIEQTIAPGECVNPLARKLRHAPTIRGDARARLAYSTRPGETDPVWSASLAISDGRTRPVWALAGRHLCYTPPVATCAGRRIGNPAAYARALAQSLENDRAFAKLGDDPLFKFTMGATFGAPPSWEELGAPVLSVAPGTDAARAGLAVGDRIIRVGETVTFTNKDVQLAIDAHGRQHGREVALPIEILRDGDVLRAQVGLAFYKPYWDARGYNGWWAAVRGFINTLSIGTAGPIACALGFKNPDGHPETRDECLRRWRIEGQALSELYSEGYLIGSFVGGLANPFSRILSRHLMVRPLLGSAAAGRLVQGTALAVIEQSVMTINSARPGATAGEILNDIQISLPQTIGLGALTTIVQP